jgi:pimeloyl-ACP methyl ester carboxylesterase
VINVIFLPGIIAPAEIRYRPLADLLRGVDARLKDLEIYAADRPPPGYSVRDEIHGIDTAADTAGLERFHLYGHSGGASCALAYAAACPGRVLSLALDEPASDFTPADRDDPRYQEIDATVDLPEPEAIPAFMRLVAGPGAALPTPPPGPPSAWMLKRPTGLRVFSRALRQHQIDPAAYAAFRQPVLYTFGSGTNPRWRAMRDRLQTYFPDFASEEFEGLHHLNTSHQAEPERTAALLVTFWRRAEERLHAHERLTARTRGCY